MKAPSPMATVLAALILAVVALPTAGQPQPRPPPAAADGAAVPHGSTFSDRTALFLREAATIDAFEVLSARVALEEAQTEAVRRYAARMADDHSATAETIAEFARAGDLALPDALDPRREALLEQLRAAEGMMVDRLYAEQQAEAHLASVQAYQRYAAEGENPLVRDFAVDTLGVLQNHLSGARALQRTLIPAGPAEALVEPQEPEDEIGVLPPGVGERDLIIER
jgi:putative membrane protein